MVVLAQVTNRLNTLAAPSGGGVHALDQKALARVLLAAVRLYGGARGRTRPPRRKPPRRERPASLPRQQRELRRQRGRSQGRRVGQASHRSGVLRSMRRLRRWNDERARLWLRPGSLRRPLGKA